MVHRERYLSTKDVMDVLRISKSAALQIMHEFENRKRAFRRGRLLRIRESDFTEWVKQYGG